MPAQVHLVTAANGDPLLLYGTADGYVMLWPTPYILQHPIAFGRWCKRHVEELRGNRVLIQHALCERTQRWAQWLGVRFEQAEVVI